MTRLVYDEGVELFHYIATYCGSQHFSEIERRTRFAHFAHSKGLTVRFLKERPGFRSIRDPEIAHELRDGYVEFMRRTSLAALRNHGDELSIARCSKCHAVLRTPIARQCVWCGHSWFHAA